MSVADSEIWAVTAYYNPTNSKRRLDNFRAFRESLSLPLAAVDWSWSKGPGHQLQTGDAEILIQVSSTDLMWQKERLLNLAIRALPASCKYVCWLDCDVIFLNPNWFEDVVLELSRSQLLQPYGTLINLDAHFQPVQTGLPGGGVRFPIGDTSRWVEYPEDFLKHEFTGLQVACGYAWAAHAPLLQRHGLYDACILGSGDRAIFYAAIGRFDDAAAYLRMGAQRRDHYLNWAVPFFQDVAGRTGWATGEMLNLWHGDVRLRRYEQRHRQFERFGFDPYADIVEGDEGTWLWATAKPDMHAHVEDYFFSRKEDLEAAGTPPGHPDDRG